VRADSASSLVVSTSAGRVRGRPWGSGFAFLGIPFAEPPYGRLRFVAPVKRGTWAGVRDCRQYGSTPQRRPYAEVTAIPEPSIPGEDVLSLNVFTPGVGQILLPVLVWIHGGGFVAGSPASPWYDGASFVRDGIVVVTIAYRLAFEGFGQLANCPANRGLLDQILALEWVKENIAAFGGNPDRVTIAGQSAGGGAAMHLAVAPSAQGLFAGVIAASPAPSDRSLGAAEHATARLANRLGIVPGRAGFARIAEIELIDAQGIGSSLTPPRSANELLTTVGMLADGAPGPVVDGELLPWTISDGIAAGAGANLPILLGTTRDEFSAIVLNHAAALEGCDPLALLRESGVSKRIAARFAQALPGVLAAQLLARSLTDRMFRRHVVEWAAVRGNANAPTFVYDFAFASSSSHLAEHCIDLPFAWDLLSEEHVEHTTGHHPPQGLADEVHGAYVAFIRDRDPGWAGITSSGRVMTWDRESEVTGDQAYKSATLFVSEGLSVR
jgi:para-nitrobenzyl esterase